MLSAAADLGYLGPNPLGRQLRSGRSGIVGVVVGLFYVVFGLFAVREPTLESWVGEDLDRIGEATLFGQQVLLTWDMIRVAILIAAFSALQFTFSAVTDEQYRREFFEGMLAEMREALAARAIYLGALVGDVTTTEGDR